MFLKTVSRLIRALFFTERCIVCQHEGTILHAACLSQFPPSDTHAYSWIYSAWKYQSPATKRLIAHIKKHDCPDLIEKCLQACPLPHSAKQTQPLIIPIPASEERMKKYGYNQAKAIAHIFSHYYQGSIVCDVLMHSEKIREKQSHISNRNKRLANKKGAYLLKNTTQDTISHRHIILIDDVSTTGATLLEARRVLMDHGALSVIGWTIAH
ncbi:ComF family protein [Candidatus Nomurabacteria bacterium]|nr:ComF family protein [Candidatus Nomurabacteria bacterium]